MLFFWGFLVVPIAHAICSIWELEPSTLHAICNILELETFHCIRFHARPVKARTFHVAYYLPLFIVGTCWNFPSRALLAAFCNWNLPFCLPVATLGSWNLPFYLPLAAFGSWNLRFCTIFAYPPAHVREKCCKSYFSLARQLFF